MPVRKEAGSGRHVNGPENRRAASPCVMRMAAADFPLEEAGKTVMCGTQQFVANLLGPVDIHVPAAPLQGVRRQGVARQKALLRGVAIPFCNRVASHRFKRDPANEWQWIPALSGLALQCGGAVGGPAGANPADLHAAGEDAGSGVRADRRRHALCKRDGWRAFLYVPARWVTQTVAQISQVLRYALCLAASCPLF